MPQRERKLELSRLGRSFSAIGSRLCCASGPGLRRAELSLQAAQQIGIDAGTGERMEFTQDGNRGSAMTGTWVAEGMTFYLQDVTGGKALTAANTLATAVVHLQTVATK